MELKDIQKEVDKASRNRDHYSVLSDLFEFTALSIAEAVDFKKHTKSKKADVLKRWSGQEQQLESLKDMLVTFYAERVDDDIQFDDYLGKLFMMSNTSNKGAGQFFTPFHVSEFSAQLAVTGTDTSQDVITLHEPSCGSGGMIVAAAKALWDIGINYTERLFVECGDIDKRCVHMTYIQLSLFGIPAVVYQRDTLRMETFDEWLTPAFLFNYAKFRKYYR